MLAHTHTPEHRVTRTAGRAFVASSPTKGSGGGRASAGAVLRCEPRVRGVRGVRAFGASARSGRPRKGGSIRARTGQGHPPTGRVPEEPASGARRQRLQRGPPRQGRPRPGITPGPASGARRRSRIWAPRAIRPEATETKTTSISFLELQTFDTARLDSVEKRVQNNENPLSAGNSQKIRTSVLQMVINSVSARRVTLRSSKSRVCLPRHRDQVGLSASGRWDSRNGEISLVVRDSLPCLRYQTRH
jgi:hypothetical protein